MQLLVTYMYGTPKLYLQCESSKTAVGSRFRVPSLSEEFEQEDYSSLNSQTELSFAGASSRLLKQVSKNSMYSASWNQVACSCIFNILLLCNCMYSVNSTVSLQGFICE